MEIVMRKVSELAPYEKNAKQHDKKQIANVANSIRRFGWQQPIVVDENGVVVIGHCRLLAAKKLGMKEVPVTVASGLTQDEIRALRIADNKTNESPWDLELLAEDIDGLNFDGFDLEFGLDAESGGASPQKTLSRITLMLCFRKNRKQSRAIYTSLASIALCVAALRRSIAWISS